MATAHELSAPHQPTAATDKPALPPRASRRALTTDDASPADTLDFNSTPSSPSRTLVRSPTAATRKSMAQETVQRWAGLTRTVTDWDGLRRDPELWFEDGDCHVHLYAQGASRRGPSLRIPFRALRQKKCASLLNYCYAETVSSTGATSELVSISSTPSLSARKPTTINLYVPAPEDATREDSFKWHITTRNFFAFVLAKPLVGYHMGQAFVDLQKRLQLFRPDHPSNHQDFLQYAENQGYRDFVECTDYALASLFYAEHFKLREVWIDAFAHCVGMYDSIGFSPEFAHTSRLTKALITRASLEVGVHLNQVATALSKFLEDDFSPTYLGLTYGARSHLNHFRSFLHGFYVEKFGYWPPPRGSAFPKALYKSMYYDFKNLYDFLVNLESTTDLSSQAPASGGLCVLQNVHSFDKRHKFVAMQHPLPLVPLETIKRESMLLRRRSLSPEYNKDNQVQVASVALARATNSDNDAVMNSRIVHAYMQYEATYTLNASPRDEKVSLSDARKIRWLVIYGTLQYLISALHAPKEVRDVDSSEYPLCCLVTGKSTETADEYTPSAIPIANTSSAAAEYPAVSPYDDTTSTIKPDCSRDDYFASRPTSRRASIDASNGKSPRTVTRSRSLSARLSRRNSLKLPVMQHCEIIVHGFGNGLNEIAPPLPKSEQIPTSYRTSFLPETAHPDSSWLASPRASALIENTPAPAPAPAPTTAPTAAPTAAPILTRPPTSTSRHTRTRTPHMDTLQLENFLSGVHVHTASFTAHAPSYYAPDPPARSSTSSSSSLSHVWSETSFPSSESSYSSPVSPTGPTTLDVDAGLLGGLVCIDIDAAQRPSVESQLSTSFAIPPSIARRGAGAAAPFSYADDAAGIGAGEPHYARHVASVSTSSRSSSKRSVAWSSISSLSGRLGVSKGFWKRG